MDIRAGETERDGQRLRLPGGERGWLLGQSSRERAGQTRVQDEPGWQVAAPRMEGTQIAPRFGGLSNQLDVPATS